MTNQEAIETLKSNYPSSNYSMLRDAVDLAIVALEKQIEYNSINEELSAKGDNAKTNLEIAKEIIEENFTDADCGLFNSRNLVGDPMITIYRKDGLTIDICRRWAYFEVFGLSADEFKELETLYENLQNEWREKKWGSLSM